MVRRPHLIMVVLLAGIGCVESVSPPTTPEPDLDPRPVSPTPASPTSPTATRPEPDQFSKTDRVQTERFLARVQRQLLNLPQERNPLIREERKAELLKSVSAAEGHIVTWEFPTNFSQDGKHILVQVPQTRGIVPLTLATTDYFQFQAPQQTALALQLGRELDAASFRKLRGGETVKVRAIVTHATELGSLELVGRIVEDPFGRAVTYGTGFETGSDWSGTWHQAQFQTHSLRFQVTDRQGTAFRGTCRDIRGSVSYAMSGQVSGETVDLTVHPRPNELERFPYFTTFRGKLTDGFLMIGTHQGGRFVFALHR